MAFFKPTAADLIYAKEVLARVAAVKTHDFDSGDYCTKCGQSHERVCDQLIECFGQSNLIAISHLRREPREDGAY